VGKLSTVYREPDTFTGLQDAPGGRLACIRIRFDHAPMRHRTVDCFSAGIPMVTAVRIRRHKSAARIFPE
jgi:hypothetical protein